MQLKEMLVSVIFRKPPTTTKRFCYQNARQTDILFQTYTNHVHHKKDHEYSVIYIYIQVKRRTEFTREHKAWLELMAFMFLPLFCDPLE